MMDIHLNYYEEGEGPLLFLLHGNGESMEYFGNQIDTFIEHFRVIAIDTRGHGNSPRGIRPFTIKQFARDLYDFMREHSIKKASILGFSDGANIAMEFALMHPECVEKLVLDGGNIFPEGLKDEVLCQIENELEQANREGNKHDIELLKLMTNEPHIKPEELGRLSMPVLVMAGTEDLIKDEHTRLIASSIPNSELAFVEGGHFIAYENPMDFNRVVLDFLV